MGYKYAEHKFYFNFISGFFHGCMHEHWLSQEKNSLQLSWHEFYLCNHFIFEKHLARLRDKKNSACGHLMAHHIYQRCQLLITVTRVFKVENLKVCLSTVWISQLVDFLSPFCFQNTEKITNDLVQTVQYWKLSAVRVPTYKWTSLEIMVDRRQKTKNNWKHFDHNENDEKEKTLSSRWLGVIF